MSRAADDADAIFARITELRREKAAAQAEIAAQPVFPCQVPPAPKVQDPPAEHVTVGWEEPAVDGQGGRVVNPALEGVFARMRGYLDDTMGQRPAEPGTTYEFESTARYYNPPEPLSASRRVVQEYRACPALVELLSKAKRVPSAQPPPPDLGEPR